MSDLSIRSVFPCVRLLLIITAALLVGIAPPAAGDAFGSTPPSLDSGCSAGYLMEPNSGAVLYEHNAAEPLPPASMVKLMTTYVTLNQAKNGILSFDDVVTVSAEASKMGGSQVYLKQGEEFTVRQLLDALIVQSANDAAQALAERVGGTREGFVDMMNDTAEELGMTHSEFHTPHGLPPGAGQKPDLISARDMAILSQALLSDFPDVIETTKLREKDFRGGEFKMRSPNHLLRKFPDADGLKTGYYRKAGFSVAATAERKGLRMLAIVMGCEKRTKRDAEAARLLQSGFSQYKQVTLIEKGEALETEIPLTSAPEPAVQPAASKTIKVFLQDDKSEEVERRIEACSALQAPISKGAPCGMLYFHLDGREIGSVRLVIPRDIPVLGWKGRIQRALGLN